MSATVTPAVFERHFDRSREDEAMAERGAFLQAFPVAGLKRLSVDRYVIGRGEPTFCLYAEVLTRAWASIHGANALKFGIYFGKTKSDPEQRYRYAQRFGNDPTTAFRAVRRALCELVEAAPVRDFRAIDRNPLSQMFKGKVISLYFPELYMNICSSNHLAKLASKAGVGRCAFASEYQHRLFELKAADRRTRRWSNPKFMLYLYQRHMPEHLKGQRVTAIVSPRKKLHRKVNFEEILAWRKERGERSEAYALEWEKNRLRALGYPKLASRIRDVRDRPSHGYDFCSYDVSDHPHRDRCIEVKSIANIPLGGNEYRFFLTETEWIASRAAASAGNYYFYLVRYAGDGAPVELLCRCASDVYAASEMEPCAYKVRFGLGKS